MTLQGEDKIAERPDYKLVINYKALMRFVTNLLPLLITAVQDTPVAANICLSRVVLGYDPHIAICLGGTGALN